MTRRLALVATSLATLLACPACVTSSAYESLTKEKVNETWSPPEPAALTRLNGASVAVVESRLQLVVSFSRADGLERFFAAPLAGLDQEPPPRSFEPLEIAALPSSVVPLRFVLPSLAQDGFAKKSARWWRDLRTAPEPALAVEGSSECTVVSRDDLEHAAFVAAELKDSRWSIFVSLPDACGRRVADTPEGPLPEVSELDAVPITLDFPGRTLLRRDVCHRIGGKLAFMGLLPLTVAADAVILAPFTPLLPLVLLLLAGGGTIGC